ncbi:MAG: hypothetical protein OQK24_00955 [Magnetovibrio sp.]|nr:hypothetical protein [Magnetovibrio sp.]
MSEKPENVEETLGSEQSVATQPGPKKPGLFARLFGNVASDTDLEIIIAPFWDANGADHGKTLGAVFSGRDGIHINTIRETPVLTAEVDRADNLPLACTQAMNWLGQENADLVLWGDVPALGNVMFIYFAAAPPQDEDPAGTISPFQALILPIGFDPETLGALVLAGALAAINPSTEKKRQTRQNLVAHALEKAAEAMENIPVDMTPREQASLQAMFANALAAFGHLFPGTEVYQRASQAYEKAIKGLLRSESPTNWAYLQRNLGTVLQALGERTDDIDILSHAETAYNAALEVFTFESTPFPWATTQNRLGEVLYRIDIKTGATANLKKALGNYQAALKVLNKRSTPMLWSETLNNFAQSAQVLGREMDNGDMVERAIAACKKALGVRKPSEQPTLWAATQNNMGSALFLLGRMTNEDDHYKNALKSFMEARETYARLGLTKMVEITEKNIAHAQDRLPEGGKVNGSEPAMWWQEEDDDT